MKEMSWIISVKKHRIKASKQFQFLGWFLNSVIETIPITKDRRSKLLRQISDLVRSVHNNATRITRDLAGIRRKLNFLRTVNPLTNFHLRDITNVINSQVK